jgi:hypothetical protein
VVLLSALGENDSLDENSECFEDNQKPEESSSQPGHLSTVIAGSLESGKIRDKT